jgi:two-component system, OmpR family, sensor histidine kinase MtrB
MNTKSGVHPPRAKFRLRRAMIGVAVALTVLTLVASASLKIVTDIIENRAHQLRTASHQAYMAEVVRADVLAFGRLSALAYASLDPNRDVELAEVQDKLYRDLDDLRRNAVPENRLSIETAAKNVDLYVAGRRQAEATSKDLASVLRAATPQADAAFSSLDEVARIGQARVADEQARVESWSRRADWIAWVVGVWVILGSAAVVFTTYKLLFRPLFELVESMTHFAGGQRNARAVPSTAIELASAADTFNDMAGVVTGEQSRLLDFAGCVAREIGDRVHVLRMTVEELKPDRPLPPEATLRARIERVGREVDWLERTVESFLDASRAEWEQVDVQRQRLDVRPLVEEVVRIYEPFSSIHQVLAKVPEQPVRIDFDGEQLSHVLNTLVWNAINYSPSGGVVEVAVAADRGEAIVAVTDHGIGVPKEDLERIFEPFHKRTQRGPHPGATVALSVARRIVHAHGGRLEVESKEGKGSTFRVRLPLADQRPIERRPSLGGGAPRRPRVTH